MDVKIVRPAAGESFRISRQRTEVPQSEKLILTMKNLCSALGIKALYRVEATDNATYFRPEGFTAYQSASNTIIELSEKVAQRFSNQ